MKGTILNPYRLIKPHQRPTAAAWQEFGLTFLLAVGTGLFLAGIIFFFAYNWSGLHYFAKFGILATSIAASSVGAYFCRRYPLAQQMLLLVASVLTGVLLAVFGQAYQLQSDSGFLAWALFILLWAIVADFHVLWLLFITVLHIGIFNICPHHEVAPWLSTSIAANVTLIIVTLLPHYVSQLPQRPRWFVEVLFFAASLLTCAALIVSYGHLAAHLLILLPFPALAGLYSYLRHDITILSMAFLVIVVEIANIFIQTFDVDGYLFGSIVIIGFIFSYVMIVKQLSQKWNTSTSTRDPYEDPE